MTEAEEHSTNGKPSDPATQKKVSTSVRLIEVCIAITLGGILPVLLFTLTGHHEGPRRSRCLSALQQIGIALHNYHDVYHSFPPAYTVDAKGRPMHSWRVLLLPHMEYGDLYAKFRMDEPWDSPHNLAVAHSNRLPIFLCPSDREADPNDTSYVMPIGPGMISDGPTAHAIKDFKDGTPNTIVVVEMSRSGILWTEPRDWTVPEGPILLNSPKGISSRSEHPGVVNVLYGDGSVNTISEGIQSESLRAMLTIDGGEPVEEMREDW